MTRVQGPGTLVNEAHPRRLRLTCLHLADAVDGVHGHQDLCIHRPHGVILSQGEHCQLCWLLNHALHCMADDALLQPIYTFK